MARAAVAREIPPPLELLCLQALWSAGEGNVNDVRRITAQTKPLAYTTVMTLLERLARKGMVSRRKAGRAYVYTPELSCELVRRCAFREFVNSFFDGSEEKLLAWVGHQPSAGSVMAAPAVAVAAAAVERLDTALL
jgi:predicted transcriptional regulator